MDVLYLLIPVAILIVLIIIGLLTWATNKGQFDDLERHGQDIIMDDDDVKKNKLNNTIK